MNPDLDHFQRINRLSRRHVIAGVLWWLAIDALALWFFKATTHCAEWDTNNLVATNGLWLTNHSGPDKPKPDAFAPPPGQIAPKPIMTGPATVGRKVGDTSDMVPPPIIRSSRIGTAPGLGVAWDSSPTADISGYRVYSGNASKVYSTSVTFGDVTSGTVPWLPGTNYLSATALMVTVIGTNLILLESDLSNEIMAVNPATNFLAFFAPSNAMLASPMVLGQIAGEPGLTSETTNGQAGWSVTVPLTGPYVLFARVLTPDSGSDSFWVDVDGTSDVFDAGTNYSGNWYYSKLVGRTPPGPRLLNLSAGTHSISFKSREAGAWLGGYWLSSQTNWSPVVATNGPTIVSFVVSVESAPTPTGPWLSLSNIASFSVTNSPGNQFIRSKVGVTRQ